MKGKKFFLYLCLGGLFIFWAVQATKTNTRIIHRTQSSQALEEIGIKAFPKEEIPPIKFMVFTLLLENPRPNYEIMRVDVYVDNPKDQAFFAALFQEVGIRKPEENPREDYYTSRFEWNTGEFDERGAVFSRNISFLFRDLSKPLRDKPWKKKLVGEKIPFDYDCRDGHGFQSFHIRCEDQDILVKSIRAYLMEALEGQGLDRFLE